MITPSYRHSDFEAFESCPFAYASGLLHRAYNHDVADMGGGGDEQAAITYLQAHVCNEGAQWIYDNCASVPVPNQNRVTQIGIAFHRFADAYTSHLIRCNIATDWSLAESMAEGFAAIDGMFNRQVKRMMVDWAMAWEYVPVIENKPQALELAAGVTERGQSVNISSDGFSFSYIFHPDYARISPDGKSIEIWDWKSGLRARKFTPNSPDRQLLRYAIGFKRLFPTIEVSYLNLLHVNPDNPLAGDPINWTVDMKDFPPDIIIITGPVDAIRMSTEFKPNPGCWLCAFCDFCSACPAQDEVLQLIDVQADDVEHLWRLLQQVQGTRQLLTGTVAHAKKMLNNYVDMNGPVIVSHNDDGSPIYYGPVKRLSARVRNMKALLSSAAEAGRDISSMLSVKSPHDLAVMLSMDDPFSDEKTDIGGFVTGWEVKHDQFSLDELDDRWSEAVMPGDVIDNTSEEELIADRGPKKPKLEAGKKPQRLQYNEKVIDEPKENDSDTDAGLIGLF